MAFCVNKRYKSWVKLTDVRPIEPWVEQWRGAGQELHEGQSCFSVGEIVIPVSQLSSALHFHNLVLPKVQVYLSAESFAKK